MTTQAWTFICILITCPVYPSIGLIARVREAEDVFGAGQGVPASANGAATAVDDRFTHAEGGTRAATVNGGENDADPVYVLTDLSVTLTGPEPLHADVFSLSSNGDLSYTHDGSETTSDSFTYQVCDPEPLCDTATVTITITSGNDRSEERRVGKACRYGWSPSL